MSLVSLALVLGSVAPAGARDTDRARPPAEAPARPDAAELRAAWERWRLQLDAHGVYPFTFTNDEWADLAAGGVARRRERLEGTDRVLGVMWVPADMDTTWLAVQDPHASVTEGLVDEDLPGSTFERRILYQSLDLPWPLLSRQWVIEVVNNEPLRKATGGAIWERTWTPSPVRGARHEIDNGVWLEVNAGGWFLAEAAGGTLLGYHARTVIGGIVPDEVATRWSFARLRGMLSGIAERTPWIREHYVGEHRPILRPGATPIPVPNQS